ncbi:MAG: S46 family peptidase [Elusimicrobiota bacterium]
MERATEGLPLLQDEGMWTFDNPPLTLLRRHYGFLPDPPWLDRVRLASVRFNDGGSGSFVSSRGLVLTNHHVALGQLQKMSGAGKDFVKDGFLARGPAREKRCPDLEINQLVSFEEVTARVNAAIDPKAPESAQNEQRKAETSRIEKESAEATGLRSEVVELYQGGE